MRALRSIALAGTAMVALAAGMTAASADPTTTPKTTDIVAVGSDTVQALFDQWSTDYNTHLGTGKTGYLYSFEATGSATIQSKNDPNCANLTRPNGSGAGIAAVQKASPNTADGHHCLDIARASRTISSKDGTGLAAVVFAKDLLTYSYNSGGNGVSNLSDSTTVTPFQELKAIWSCDASILGTGKTGPVTWNEVGGTSTDAIIPVLPQSSSGTRSTWLADLGITTIASCVVNGTYNGTLIEENEGTNAVFTQTGNPTGWKDVAFPYSAGAYEGETFYHTNPQSPGNLILGDIDGKNPISSPGNINVTGFPSTYVRSLFAVVNSTGVSPYVPTSPTNLQPLLGKSDSSGWICTGSNTTVGTGPYDITHAGFVKASNCGTVLNHT